MHLFLLARVFITILIFSLALSQYNQFQLVCPGNGNFANGSRYGENLHRTLTLLPSNATDKSNLFYTASSGQGYDTVYALALCRGDYTEAKCSYCLRTNIENIQKKCPNKIEAISWAWVMGDLVGYPCLIRYSNRPLVRSMEMVSGSGAYSTPWDNIWANIEKETWDSFIDKLTNETAASRLKVRAEEQQFMNFTLPHTIFALAQCTPDLPEEDCRNCLKTAHSDASSNGNSSRGGSVYYASCFFEWEFYNFYSQVKSGEDIFGPARGNHVDSTISGIHGDPTNIFLVTLSVISSVATVCLTYLLFRRKQMQKREAKSLRETLSIDELQFDYSSVRDATANFSDTNKLGDGGFGSVYKAILLNNQVAAVKRLKENSTQGEDEFKNEVRLLARLQHRNLVKLLGFCLHQKERLLIYEFLPNSSLNKFILDSSKRAQLDWQTRYKIIKGVARGLLYLHEDSCLRIIHRDLKAENILLDGKMNAKISDFGMARWASGDQTHTYASKVAGTYGYIAPEYIVHRHLSLKSDVYSYGVLVLEVTSGQRITNFGGEEDAKDLLTYAWRNWNEDTLSNLIDPLLCAGSRSEVTKCIQIALLCIQEMTNRPSMASVLVMLNGSSDGLPIPCAPEWFRSPSRELETSSSLDSQV